jgi:hypothetical protein
MDKDIVHLQVGLGNDSLCGKQGTVTDLPDLLKLDKNEEACKDCIKRIAEIASQLQKG